jgi:hypothetical protein
MSGIMQMRFIEKFPGQENKIIYIIEYFNAAWLAIAAFFIFQNICQKVRG